MSSLLRNSTLETVFRPFPNLPIKVVQGKCPLHFLHFNGAICSNTVFSNTSALPNSLLYRANSTCKSSRTPRWVQHFWVPILGASCSNKLFVGALRLSQQGARLKSTRSWWATVKPRIVACGRIVATALALFFLSAWLCVVRVCVCFILLLMLTWVFPHVLSLPLPRGLQTCRLRQVERSNWHLVAVCHEKYTFVPS